jgi:RHS repeat-associated protein
MEMPGRQFTSSSYRYGFNGKENDPEANAGAQDFGMREYDNRLGRFFSVDPFTKLVFNKTPYCFAGNSPIAFIDKNGGFQIPPGVAKTYPELNNIAIAISNAVNSNPTINNSLIKEFIVASGLDPNDPNSVNEALRVLSYGSGPVVQIDPKLGFSDYGLFSEATPDIIYISKAFADELKREVTRTRRGNVKPVYVNGANMLWMMLTLWHEAIHYEDLCSDGVSQPDRDRNDPTSLDVGGSATEEIFNCNPPSSPNNLANRVKAGTSTISIENMNLYRYELSKWFKDNTIKNMAKPARLVPGPYVNPNRTSTSAGARSSKGGSYGSVRSLD